MLKFIKKFTDEKIDCVRLGNRFFLAEKQLVRLNDSLKQKPDVLGVFLGEEKAGKFAPSLALLEILAKSSKEKVFVKSIGELDFLYGKDLRKRHIDRFEGEWKVGFMKLVQNGHDENLGYAKIVASLESSGAILKVKLDRGDFLRREK